MRSNLPRDIARSPRGFTLIELLVVIAIIAILAAILFPVFAKARDKARQSKCMSNVRQMLVALQIYVQDHNSRFPEVGEVWQEVNFPPNATVCPSHMKAKQGYGFNFWLGGQNPQEEFFPEPQNLVVLTDSADRTVRAGAED